MELVLYILLGVNLWGCVFIISLHVIEHYGDMLSSKQFKKFYVKNNFFYNTFVLAFIFYPVTLFSVLKHYYFVEGE